MPIESTVVSIWIASAAGGPMQRRSEITAVAGKGLAGDRYASGEGTFSRFDGPRREVTFISEEEIVRAYNAGIQLEASDFRRNIVCTGVDLSDLIAKTFSIGEATFRGITTAGPCGYLARLVGIETKRLKEVLPGIRCGLRAQIIVGGKFSEGDRIRLS